MCIRDRPCGTHTARFWTITRLRLKACAGAWISRRLDVYKRQGLADLRRAGNGNAGSSRLLVAGEALHADLALVDLLETGKPRQNKVDQRIITACVKMCIRDRL